MTTPHPATGPLIARQVLVGLLLTFGIVAAVETGRSFHGNFGWTFGTLVEAGAGTLSVRQQDGRNRFQAELEGEVRFNADETGIEHMAPAAYFELEEEMRSGSRRLEARAGDGGVPELRWWLDGKSQEPDAAARAWLATAIPRFLRTAGIDVEGRVARFLAKGGVPAVLAEIEQISPDATMSAYFEQLFAQTAIDSDQLASVLRIAGRDVGTDAELAGVLALVPAARLDSAELRRLYVRAAETIGTDAELRRTLERLAADPSLDAETLDALLAVATTIGTDAELAAVLDALLAAQPRGWEPPASFFAAVETVGTRSEHERLLAAASSAGG